MSKEMYITAQDLYYIKQLHKQAEIANALKVRSKYAQVLDEIKLKIHDN